MLKEALSVVKGSYMNKGAWELSDEDITIKGLRKRFRGYNEE
jgi:hypothetical protein